MNDLAAVFFCMQMFYRKEDNIAIMGFGKSLYLNPINNMSNDILLSYYHLFIWI